MINSENVKKIAFKHGSDICGIAPVERFNNAPAGFHPRDVFGDVKSVIAFACRAPEGPLDAINKIPYTVNENILLDKVHRIALDISLDLENWGVKAVIAPSEPYDSWDTEKLEGRGILSLKHSANLAGLGVIGKNTLLCNRSYGNLIKLGALLTDAILEGDPIESEKICIDSCNLCIRSCPVNAIDNYTVDQKKCRTYSETKNKKDIGLYTCNECRKVCPNRSGSVKKRVVRIF